MEALPPRLDEVAELVDEDQRDEADGEAPAPQQRVPADREEERAELDEDEAELDREAEQDGDRRPGLPQQVAEAASRLDRLVVPLAVSLGGGVRVRLWREPGPLERLGCGRRFGRRFGHDSVVAVRAVLRSPA